MKIIWRENPYYLPAFKIDIWDSWPTNYMGKEDSYKVLAPLSLPYSRSKYSSVAIIFQLLYWRHYG